ncbi:MAG: transporter substrate-binding domain-containing protein [Candidatus Competibacteraceae bacterium]
MGIKSIADLKDATICVTRGTTHRRNLETYFAAKDWPMKPLVINSASEAEEALFAGRCRAYTSDAAQLAGIRLHAPKDRQAFVILPERISKEPLEPRRAGAAIGMDLGDPVGLNILILAEEYGITRDNLDAVIAENKNLWCGGPPMKGTSSHDRWVSSLTGDTGRAAVGNYGEIYERNVGRDSPLKIERGLNRLWTQGGLHYAPPID